MHIPPIGSLRSPLTDLSEKQAHILSLPRYHGEGGPRKRWKGHKDEAVGERSLFDKIILPLYYGGRIFVFFVHFHRRTDKNKWEKKGKYRPRQKKARTFLMGGKLMRGTFYGIGVGPGDPELLTVKAIKAIEAADVLIAPKTEKKDGSVALKIARPYLKEGVEIVYQVFPMVKDFAKNPEAWEENKTEILALLDAGKNVAFLTLGDPMFYSTYIYVFRLMEQEDVEIVTIPGVPAFAAIGSRLNRPIVEGDDILAIIPATADRAQLEKIMAVVGSAVVMKVYRNYPEIVDLLAKNNMAEDAVLVSRAGLDDEKIVRDIGAHRDAPLNYLSTILARRN